MAGQFPTPSFRVPGLLDDAALQEQLKQFTDQSNRVDRQGPSPAALGMADKITSDYLDKPLNRALKLSSALVPPPVGPALGAISTLVGRGGTPPPDPQQQAIDTRSDILSNNGIGGAIGRSLIAGPLGTLVGDQSPLTRLNRLTPEEAQADADQRVEDRKNAEAAIAADADARQKLRNMSDAEAAQMGLPVAPGGTDPVTDSEQADRRAAFDAERLKQAQKDTAEAEKIAATPEAQATLPWWLNAAREALRGAERVPTSAMKTVAILNEARYGFEGGRSDMRAWVDTIDATFDKLLPADKARAKDFASKLSQGTGSLAGFLTMGALGGLAGLSTKVTTAGIGAAVNASTQFEDAEAHNATALNKYLTLFAASAIGATEALPIDRMLRRAEAATGGLVSRMLINTAASSIEEFLQEFGQNVGNDVVAQWTYDTNRSIDWRGAFEQGAIGAISGGMASSATTALTEAGVLPKAAPVETTERKEPEPVVDEAQQEDFLKRFFTQSQAVLDKMKADVAYDEQLTTPTPVVEPVPGETAERAPNDIAEPVPVEKTPAEIATSLKTEEVRPVTVVAEDFAKALPRPELFEPSGVTGRGGTQPRTAADGNIVLRHQARAVREELDPEQMGTGPIVGVERKRLVGPDAVGRVYFGVDSGPDFQQPAVPLKEYVKVSDEEVAAAKTLGIDKRRLVQALERRWYAARDAGQGYVDEGLGPIVHEVTVGRDDLYNMAEDPLNLRAQLPDDLTPPERTTRYERLVKEAGFRGALFPGRQGMGRTAILFNKEKPSRVVDSRYGLPVNEIATPEDFANPTAAAFRKGGWAVITGTQEAQGPFSSEENIKANNKLRDRLIKDGVRFEEVSGAYQGTPQGTSFLIFAPESYALQLGKSFKQESILTRDGLVYSDGSDKLVPARGVTIGDEALSSDFHSTLPNGTPFSVNLDFEAEGNRDQLLGQRTANTPEAAIAAVELTPDDLKPLPGLKTGKPVESVVRAARAYAESVGLPVRRQSEYVKVDVERAKRIAQAYEDMKDEPTDPKVAAAYDAMIEETLAQYQFVKATGLKVEAIEEGQDDPYPEGPKQVLEDLERGHLWFFPTDQGFGTLAEAQKANPLLRETEEKLGNRVLVANDIFRIVHDFFGHGIEGSGFGARGEENAWQSHMRLYSEAALPAVTSETRGQNSWVNYGPHGEANRANQRETVYADQKAGIMPSWTWTEGVAEDMPLDVRGQRTPVRTGKLPLFPGRNDQSFDRWFAGSKVVDAKGKPLVVYHGTPSAEGFRVFDPNKTGTTSVLFSAIETHRQGFFFAENPEFAKGFAEQRRGGRTMELFLSIKNPFDAREFDNVTRQRAENIAERIAEIDPEYDTRFFTDRVGGDDFWEVLDTPENGDVVVQAMRDLGYDGIRMIEPNHDTRESETVWVAFDNTQIKSAEENTGAYSPTNPDIYAARTPGGTASARGPLRGEQTRPKKGIAGGTDEGRDDVSLSKLAQNVIDLLNLTARQGRFTLKGSNVVGQFSARQNVVRLKTWNDLSTLVHEGAHAVEQAAGPALRQWIDGNKAGLEKVAKALYGGDVSKMPPKEVVSEGFAEFFRVYTLNRGFTTQKYPTLAQDFTDLLEKTDPQLKAGLDVIGDQFAAWLQLPSAQLVRNMVVSGRQTAGINAAIKELQDKGFGTWFNDLVTKTVQETTNRYAYLNKLIAELLNLGQENIGQSIDLKYADDPRVLIRLATNVGNRAMVQTTDGVMPYHDVNPTTQGLRAALLRYHGLGEDQHLKEIDPVRQKDFAAYLIALRGIDEYRRLAEGKIERPPLAATLGDLRLTVKEMNDRYGTDFAEAAKIVHEYGMALWQKAFDAGLMTRQTFKDGLDRQFYVPLQRDMSDKDVTTSDMADAMAAGKGRSIVKRFRGSDRDIIDPVDALMQKTFSLERVIAENDVKLALARLADKAGKAGALVERVPAHRLLGQEYSVQEIARQLTKDDTVSEADAQDLMTILEASIEEGNRVALFRSQQAVAGGDNIVFFWEQGKLAAVQLKDGDVGADVVNTLNGIGRENMPVFVETIAAASTAFRTAITSWPDFLLVNFIRDQASAWILTDVGYKPFATGLRGVMDEVRQNQWARQYNAAMGLMGGMNTAALHKVRVERDLDALRGKGYLVRAFSEKGITGAIKGLGRIVEVTETGSRMGIFRSAYNRAKKDGLTDWEASIEAAYLATDYIDFGLNGNRMLMWRRLVPFLNAQLQGLAKLMRTVGGGEVRQRKGLNFALRAYFKDINGLDLSRTEKLALQTGRKAILKMMSISFIGAALSMAFWDDPDYQDASEYLRATGWVIPLGDGRIFYIPKPFELAVFSNFVERGIETAAGDADAPKKFLRGVAMNLTPPVAPPAVQQLVEQVANYDFFTGREIVPDYMRALAPELQYDRTTSELAKNIGSVLGVSPMRVEHTLSGIGASAYRDVSFMYNSVMGEDRPSSDVTNWPITRRFIRDARRGSQSAKDFWAYASTVNGSLRSAEVTYKTMVEEGRERAANEFLDTLEPDARAYAILNTHFKTDAKRLNPFYRVRQISTIVSALRREMTSPLGVEDSTTKFSEPVKLSAKEKYEIDQVLSEYMRREMRNTLIYMQDPGWRYKTPLPTDTTFDLLDKTNAFVFDELNRRIRKANIYSADTVQEYWPEARDRLLSDREDAFLKDLTVIAKVMR